MYTTHSADCRSDARSSSETLVRKLVKGAMWRDEARVLSSVRYSRFSWLLGSYPPAMMSGGICAAGGCRPLSLLLLEGVVVVVAIRCSSA